MTELEHLCELLSETGLYDPGDNSVIYAELAAYAEGLELFFGELEELLRECFVSTAEAEGLTMREAIIRRMNFNHTLAGRRSALTAAMSVGTRDVTSGDLAKVIASFGLTGRFVFDPTRLRITLETPQTMSAAQQSRLESEMSRLLPCWTDIKVLVTGG